MVTDSGQIVVREQWHHPYNSLFRFHISVANIVQSSVPVDVYNNLPLLRGGGGTN